MLFLQNCLYPNSYLVCVICLTEGFGMENWQQILKLFIIGITTITAKPLLRKQSLARCIFCLSKRLFPLLMSIPKYWSISAGVFFTSTFHLCQHRWTMHNIMRVHQEGVLLWLHWRDNKNWAVLFIPEIYSSTTHSQWLWRNSENCRYRYLLLLNVSSLWEDRAVSPS